MTIRTCTPTTFTASNLAFNGVGEVVSNVTALVEHPKSYEALFVKLEDKFCSVASTKQPKMMPASIVGDPYDALLHRSQKYPLSQANNEQLHKIHFLLCLILVICKG